MSRFGQVSFPALVCGVLIVHPLLEHEGSKPVSVFRPCQILNAAIPTANPKKTSDISTTLLNTFLSL